jgi:hypothetical protein
LRQASLRIKFDGPTGSTFEVKPLMPTQIPVRVERSYAAEARAALMQSLLSAAIISTITLVIVWAYT